MTQHIGDWLRAHKLSAPTVLDIVHTCGSSSLLCRPFDEANLAAGDMPKLALPSLKTSLKVHVIPALSNIFGDEAKVSELVSQISFVELGPNEELPHTEDLGHEHPPIISMDWRGTAADLICLAHEVAHALQIQMSDHETMPPVAREVCAFLGEIALIEYCGEHAQARIPQVNL
jgi:hypothetical protein